MSYVPAGKINLTAVAIRELADRILADELLLKEVSDKVRMDLASGSTRTVTEALYRVRAVEREMDVEKLLEELAEFAEIVAYAPSWIMAVFEPDFDLRTPNGMKEARGALRWLRRNATGLHEVMNRPEMPTHRSKGKRR